MVTSSEPDVLAGALAELADDYPLSLRLAETAVEVGNRLFTLENTKLQVQDQLAVAQGNIALNLVNVYRALGGGWDIRFHEGYCEAWITRVAPAAAPPPATPLLPRPKPHPQLPMPRESPPAVREADDTFSRAPVVEPSRVFTLRVNRTEEQGP